MRREKTSQVVERRRRSLARVRVTGRCTSHSSRIGQYLGRRRRRRRGEEEEGGRKRKKRLPTADHVSASHHSMDSAVT